MDEDEYEYRNDYWDEAEDRRNRRRPARVRTIPPPQLPVPWRQPMQPIVVAAPARRGFRDIPTGVWADVATMAYTAFIQQLPTPPTLVGDEKADLSSLINYQSALANYTKRNEQIRTAGAIVRLFI